MIKRFIKDFSYYDIKTIDEILYFYDIGLLRKGLLCEGGRCKGMYF